MTDRDLILKAQKASEMAYAPYSRLPAGAALECADGTVVTGCSVETGALGGTICAERTAAVKAISMGKRNFRRIAVYAAGMKDYYTPCGACLQFLSEFGEDMDILCVRGDNRYVSYHLSDLLPHPFRVESVT